MERLPGLVFLPVVVGSLAVPATPWAAGDPERGKTEFLRCAICHAAESNVHNAGPGLAAVYGRTAGTVEGFTRYSDALKRANVVWTDETLDAWLRDPQAFIPGNTMTMRGIADAQVRQDIIAYLKDLAARHEAAGRSTKEPVLPEQQP